MNISDNIIQKYRKAKKSSIFFSLTIKLSLTISILLLTISLFEEIHYFSKGERQIFFFALLVTTLSVVGFYFRQYILQTKPYRQNDRQICQMIEKESTEPTVIWQLYDLLLYLKDHPNQDNSLTIAAIEDYNSKLTLSFQSQKKSQKLPQESKVKLAFLTLLLLILIITPLKSAFNRIISFNQEFKRRADHSLLISLKNSLPMENDTLIFTCKTIGKRAEFIYFNYQKEGEAKWSTLKINQTDSLITHKMVLASGSAKAYFSSPQTNSDTLNFSVTNYPRLKELTLTIAPPPHTALPSYTIKELTNTINLYAGTVLKFQVKTDQISDTLQLSWQSEKVFRLPNYKQSQEANWQVKVLEPAQFSFKFYKNNLLPPNPINYKITISEDQHPSIKILTPTESEEIPQNNTIFLLASASDDFQITKATAILKKIGSQNVLGDFAIKESNSTLNFELKPQNQSKGLYLIEEELNLNRLNLFSGESVELVIKVTDNDYVNGPKSTFSTPILLKMPTLEELFKESEESYKEQKELSKNQIDKSKEIREQIKKMTDELKLSPQNKENSNNNLQKLDQIIEKQKESFQELEKMEKSLAQNMENLEKNSLLSKETMDKYRRLQKLIDNLFNEDLKKRLDELNKLQNDKELQKEELQNILNNLEEEQKRFQESIEKTMALLEQVATEQQLDKLLKQFNDILEKQETLNQQLKESNKSPKEQLLKREDEILDRYKNSTQDLKKLGETENSSLKKIKEEIDKINQNISQDNLTNLMLNQQSETKANQTEKSLQSGEKIAQKLAEQASQLQQLKDSFNKAQKEELQKKLERVAAEVLSLSFLSEELKDLSTYLTSKSSLGSEILTNFADLERSINKTSQKIYEIAKQTFFIDQKIGQKLNQTATILPIIKQILESRNFQAAQYSQIELFSTLNQLVVLLWESAQKVKDAESASGMTEMLKKLEELAKQQADLNKESQEMQGGSEGGMPMSGTSGKGGSGSGQGESMMDKMNRLAQEQAAIQEALNKLMGENGLGQDGKNGQKSGGKEGGNSSSQGQGQGKGQKKGSGEESGQGETNANKLGKKLGEMSKGAEDILNEMQNKIMTESIIKKQDTLLKHLLETAKSIRQERFSEKREGEYQNQQATKPNSKLILQQGLREKLIRSLQEGYNQDYQQKIKEYFELLEK